MSERLTRVLGRIEVEDGAVAVVFDRQLRDDARRPLQACTDPDRLARWFRPGVGRPAPRR
jgi:uncharacterized protein YndB with AHSA1/START domain